jgi:hypothetical protein
MALTKFFGCPLRGETPKNWVQKGIQGEVLICCFGEAWRGVGGGRRGIALDYDTYVSIMYVSLGLEGIHAEFQIRVMLGV